MKSCLVSAAYIIGLICFGMDMIADSYAQAVFYERPAELQLYTRDQSDSAAVRLRGIVTSPGFDSVRVTIFQNGLQWKKEGQVLTYQDSQAEFDLSPKIYAGLFEYKLTVDLISSGATSSVLTVDSVVCGDAYILSGQSNSHLALADADYQDEFCRTFGVKTGMSNYDPYDPADTLWAMAQGSSDLGPGVGALGLYIQKNIREEYQMPTCLINGGTGGSVISEHLPNAANRTDLTTIYGKVLYRMQKAGLESVRAIIWHQGENDSDEENTPAYPARFTSLYNAWKNDFDPQLIYVFQIRPGCGGSTQSAFREMQRTLPQTTGLKNVYVMATAGINGHYGDGCHYNSEGYRQMAGWLHNLIRADFYGSTDTEEIMPPDISSIVYDRQNYEMHLTFKNTSHMAWPADSLGQSMKNYFYFDGDYGLVDSGWTSGNTVYLKLKGPNFVDKMTYLPDKVYNDVAATYEGPWLRNTKGIGALSFYNVPVQNPEIKIQLTEPNGGELYSPQTEQEITWTQSGIDKIRIQFSPDDGHSWVLIGENIDANAGSFTWLTPDTVSMSCKIRLSSMLNPTTADESNNVFSIFKKTISVFSPNGGEVWQVGSTQMIMWTSQFIDRVRIQYSPDNGITWKSVKRFVDAIDGQLEWQVPAEESPECLVRINDLSDVNIFDDSDTTFTITATSDIEKNDQLPVQFNLVQNQPNPFNPVTEIKYQLPERSVVHLIIYDIQGRVISEPVNSVQPPGNYSYTFDAAKYGISSGILFYRLNAGRFSAVRKMILAK